MFKNLGEWYIGLATVFGILTAVMVGLWRLESKRTNEKNHKEIMNSIAGSSGNIQLTDSHGNIIQQNVNGDNVVNQIKGKDPYLQLGPQQIHINDKFNDGKTHYWINWAKMDGPATNVNIDSYVLFDFTYEGNQHYSLLEPDYFPAHTRSPNASFHELAFIDKKAKVNDFYLYLNGTYANHGNTSTFEIDELYHFDGKTTSMLVGERKLEILKIIDGLKPN